MNNLGEVFGRVEDGCVSGECWALGFLGSGTCSKHLNRESAATVSTLSHFSITYPIVPSSWTLQSPDLASLIGRHHRDSNFYRILDHIIDQEYARGRPLLTAIIVRKGEATSGVGFFNADRRLGGWNRSDPLGFWRTELERVYQYWGGHKQMERREGTPHE